eukprot:TRINITY_DN19655_c0_g1_i1.p1 TRINITY_DN19655_c0_g1~~TRINITY_DN19655_c0_g1_i1.p1  ORF type:complete len:496 (-),score=59.04 TRINITY_DN19655_c0_g1_i1:839-2326(-)
MASPPLVYQVWKGNNKFFCRGGVIFGPDYKSFFITVLLITGPSVLFYVFVCPSLLHKLAGGVAVLVVAILLASWDLALLMLTSSRDPGIIPRNLQPPEPEPDDPENPRSSYSNASDSGRLRLPRTKDVMVNGVAVKIKYCDTCMLYRPPRCSHCSICNNCVERFDHHCPWVGQCIGKRNYRYFFLFVLSTSILCIYVFVFSAINIRLIMRDLDLSFLRALAHHITGPVSVALMAYTFISVWFVGGLTVFHSYLMWTNQTTYENFRYKYDRRVNPYNRGGAKNIREIICSPIQPSKNWFRAPVLELEGVPTTPGSEGGSMQASGVLTRSDLVAVVGYETPDRPGIQSPARSPLNRDDTGVEVGGVVLGIKSSPRKDIEMGDVVNWGNGNRSKEGSLAAAPAAPAKEINGDGLLVRRRSDAYDVDGYPEVIVDYYKKKDGAGGNDTGVSTPVVGSSQDRGGEGRVDAEDDRQSSSHGGPTSAAGADKDRPDLRSKGV